MNNWELGKEHKYYGKVVMMRTIEGESYRFFLDKDKVVSMIPLSTLQLEDMLLNRRGKETGKCHSNPMNREFGRNSTAKAICPRVLPSLNPAKFLPFILIRQGMRNWLLSPHGDTRNRIRQNHVLFV